MAVKICRDSLLYSSANEKNFNIIRIAILGCMCKQISINYNNDTVIALIKKIIIKNRKLPKKREDLKKNEMDFF